MVPKKGFVFAVDAAARLLAEGRKLELRFVGRGPLEGELRDRVRELGLEEHVRFLGFQPPDRMGEVYRSCHVLVMPSIIDADGDRDGIPNVGLEAMAHGLPLVGSRVSGIPEIVEEGRNGFLAPPGDPEGLADAMAAVMDHPDPVSLGRASRTMVEERFDAARNVRELLGVMEAHVRGRAPCAG